MVTASDLLKLFSEVDEKSRDSCDNFFSNNPSFFPGSGIQAPADPYKSFTIYESNLKKLKEKFPEKFDKAHKGTPYFFMGWTSFDLKNYGNAVFFMDAALSEDIHNFPNDWESTPAADFLFLRTVRNDEKVNVALRIIQEAYGRIDTILKEFNTTFNTSLTVADLVNKFVRYNIENNSHRSIVTSLYTFIYEADDNFSDLKIRSTHGGSIEPFISHLFRGCLVFESILKEVYTSCSGLQLGNILQDQFISKDLVFKSELISTTGNIRGTLQDIVKHLLHHLKDEDPQNHSIALTYALRNTTGHSLLWPDVFLVHYVKLYNAVLFSILYLVIKKY